MVTILLGKYYIVGMPVYFPHISAPFFLGGGMHLWVLNVGCTNLKTSKLLLTFVSSELNLINGAKEDISVI